MASGTTVREHQQWRAWRLRAGEQVPGLGGCWWPMGSGPRGLDRWRPTKFLRLIWQGHGSASKGRRRSTLWSRERRQGGAPATMVVHGAMVVLLGRRSVRRGDGRICRAPALQSVHPRDFGPQRNQILESTSWAASAFGSDFGSGFLESDSAGFALWFRFCCTAAESVDKS